VNCEVVGMCEEAVPVLGAESVDFLFYLTCLCNYCVIIIGAIRSSFREEG
jgi:hypothetical protein